MAGLLNVIIALIVIGVLLWGFRRIIALVPMDAWLKTVVDTLVVVLVVVAVVVYVIVPALHMLAGQLHL